MLRAPARQVVTSLKAVLGDCLGNKALLPQLPSPSEVIYELFHSSALQARCCRLWFLSEQVSSVSERRRCLISATEVSGLRYGFPWKPCGVAGLNDSSWKAQLGDSHSCGAALGLPGDGE